MSSLLFPAAVALFLWWFTTGVVLYLDGLPRRTYGWTMLGGVAVALVALYVVASTSGEASPAGAYAAFVSALLVWGMLEMSYYLDFVTGVHRMPCPPGCSQWRRFALALGTSVYHEIAVVGTAGVLAVLTWDEPNRVALWTYLVLWGMRWSAKLNLFLGVSNFHQEWLPGHLRYMVSYTVRRRCNLLFPISVTVPTVLAVLLVDAASSAHASAHDQAGLTLVGALLVLAVLEHWFLVLPLADGALWRWALRPESAPRRLDVREPSPAFETGSRGVGQGCRDP